MEIQIYFKIISKKIISIKIGKNIFEIREKNISELVDRSIPDSAGFLEELPKIGEYLVLLWKIFVLKIGSELMAVVHVQTIPEKQPFV